MERVTGIGGVFFRSKDPAKLRCWYRDHLGVKPTPTTYEEACWMQSEGPTVFAPFEEKTEYFGAAQQMWMINFRVADMQKMVDQLRGAGIEVKITEDLPIGLFARLQDPEGNPIELWEPRNVVQ